VFQHPKLKECAVVENDQYSLAAWFGAITVANVVCFFLLKLGRNVLKKAMR
jgi:hypothetical protein